MCCAHLCASMLAKLTMIVAVLGQRRGVDGTVVVLSMCIHARIAGTTREAFGWAQKGLFLFGSTEDV